MKKIFFVMMAITLLAASVPARNMSLALTVSYLGKADAGFNDIYGSGGVQPGLRFEARLGEKFSLYGSYGYFSKKGETPVLREEARSTQHFISAGAAWSRELAKKLDLKLYAGLLYVNYKEEALGETIKDSALGLEIGGGMEYRISERFFLFPFVSYMIANDSIGEIKVKLGGFKAGAGLGVRF
jgi:opacity protein-like surface antigen